MKFIYENIAYARSVLRKANILEGTPEWGEYQSIRKMVGEDHGYVGILTKLRFIDSVKDMDELKSIYEILKKSKFDFAKLNRLTYEEILDIFYDDLSKESKEDIELVYRDKTYSYYRVHTYKGILDIGSPSWCLKTKSNWDRYQEVYTHQWVVVDNRYKKNLITPNNNYLSNYKSDKGYIRYGISCRLNNDGTVTWIGFSDNNTKLLLNTTSHTFFGVLCTILNLMTGVKKSYYDEFRGCKKYGGSWHVVDDIGKFIERTELGNKFYDNDKIYVSFSESYSAPLVMICMNDSNPYGFFATKREKELEHATLSGGTSKKIFEEHALNSDSDVYLGVKLKLGKVTMSDIEKSDKYVSKTGKWAIFNRNDNYWLVVNLEVSEYQIRTKTLSQKDESMNDPVYWYVDKKKLIPLALDNKTISDPVINYIKNNIEEDVEKNTISVYREEPEEDEKTDTKKVRGFWDFLKRKKK